MYGPLNRIIESVTITVNFYSSSSDRFSLQRDTFFGMELSTFKEKNGSVRFKFYVYNFYLVFISFGYHTLLIPYKFVSVDSGYELYTNNIRKASETLFYIFSRNNNQ